ncbi:MAG: hypothetical protein EOM19_08090, partial [Candidatus Moranbacteria bacterium]|nr:hypothetical protein [Candidatus Moranbacteria bacterium]
MMKVENQRLKDFLLDSDLIEKEKVEASFLEVEKNGKNLADFLLEKEFIQEVDLQKLIAYILGVPFVELEKTIIDPDILQIIPEPIAKKYTIVAFEKKGRDLKVAMLHPEDLQTIDFIAKKSGLKIIACFTT